MALGYLLGFVPGPIVAAVGGLALATFGRGLELSRIDEARVGLALAVIAGAAGVAALRWGTLELEELRGAQAVLGPTVLVGPTAVAAACWAALIVGSFALGLWIAPVSRVTGRDRFRLALETSAGALLLVSVFWGPAVVGASVGNRAAAALGWAVASLVVAGLAYVSARFVGELAIKVQLGAMAAAAVVVGAAAAVVSVSL